MECLVCANEKALDRSHPNWDHLSVDCPSCGRYRITCTALDRFLGLPREARKEALEKAKRLAEPDSIPMIGSNELVG